MRILFVTPYLPGLVRVRPYQFILGLARRGHEITLLTLTDGRDEWGAREAMRAVGVQLIVHRLPRWRPVWNSLRNLGARRAFQAQYASDPAFTRRALQLSTGMDVAHIEHLRAASVAYPLQREAKLALGAPVVWDSVDCISRLLRQAAEHSTSWFGRIAARLDLRRTTEAERLLACAFDRVLVTTEVDCQALAALGGPEARLAVVPNGVDTAYFRPEPAQPRESATLVVSGKMSYHANITMVQRLVERILPRVWQNRPEVRLVITGHHPPRVVRQYSADPRIAVTGSVPDMRPYLQGATLAVAPLTYGVGVQNKALEAMACGAPLVASPEAVAGLHSAAHDACCIAADDDAFAGAILNLLAAPDRRAALSVAGRAYVETHHQWATSIRYLESIYEEVRRAHYEYAQGLR